MFASKDFPFGYVSGYPSISKRFIKENRISVDDFFLAHHTWLHHKSGVSLRAHLTGCLRREGIARPSLPLCACATSAPIPDLRIATRISRAIRQAGKRRECADVHLQMGILLWFTVR